MAKRTSKEPDNHLRAWREFRGLTQDELAKRVGTTASVVSLLETGERGLSLKWLRKFGPALNVRPGILLDHNPHDLDTSVLEVWASIPQESRAQAGAVLRAFARETPIPPPKKAG